MFDLTTSGLVSTLDVNNVANPVRSYQITGLGTGDVANAAGYDPGSNQLYYVDNHGSSGTAELDSLQFNSQGAVVSQNVIGTLPSQVTRSLGADFYDGRFWLSQNDTNLVYGFDPNHFQASPIVLTLAPPSTNASTLFNLGDLTFNSAAGTMFIAGNIGAGEPTFIYEYAMNGTGSPSLVASRVYTSSTSDPMFNGIVFDQATGVLYGFAESTGQLYTIDTSTLTVSTDVGSNPALLQFGDLAGFTPNAISAVPEPSSLIGLASGVSIILACRLSRVLGGRWTSTKL